MYRVCLTSDKVVGSFHVFKHRFHEKRVHFTRFFWDLQKLKCVGANISTFVLGVKCLSISWMMEHIFFSPDRFRVPDLHPSKVKRS